MARADRLTIRQKKRTVYSDFRTDFGKNEFTGYLGKLTNEDAVKQAFSNLMQTNNGERYMDADYGGNLTAYLFENIDSDTLEVIKMQIQSAVDAYDRRINILKIEMPNYNKNDEYDAYGKIQQIDSNVMSIRIVFSVVNLPDALSVDVDVERIR